MKGTPHRFFPKFVDWDASWEAVAGKAREDWEDMISAETWELDVGLMQVSCNFIQDRKGERRLQPKPFVPKEVLHPCGHLGGHRVGWADSHA